MGGALDAEMHLGERKQGREDAGTGSLVEEGHRGRIPLLCEVRFSL
jgi:hypothetical protein